MTQPTIGLGRVVHAARSARRKARAISRWSVAVKDCMKVSDTVHRAMTQLARHTASAAGKSRANQWPLHGWMEMRDSGLAIRRYGSRRALSWLCCRQFVGAALAAKPGHAQLRGQGRSYSQR